MEGLGKKLQEARLARNLTLDEAARMTKIRPGRLQEIENEDFSEFASLAYAKGFLLIYGKFLDVDVSPYLEAFETSESVTVDGYSYLQDNPAPKPSRPVAVRKHSGGGRGSFVPFVIGVIVLVVGFVGMKMILEVQRLKPSPRPVVGASPTATAAPEKIIAPHALPIENVSSPAPTIAITPTTQPTVAAPSPISQPAATEPEVRRAEPVRPQDLPKAKPSPSPVVRRQFRTPGTNLGPRVSPTPRPLPR
jgi:cytoskeleton protein RodZ